MIQQQTPSILLCGSYAPSLINFRGPLIEDMVKRGWRVFATAPDIDSQISEQIRALGAVPLDVEMSRTGLSLAGDFSYLWQLKKIIRDQEIDAVLSYTIKPNIWGAFAAAMAEVPSVAMVTGLGYAFTDGTAPAGRIQLVVKKMARFLYRQALKRSARVVFQNRDDRSDLIAAGCLDDVSKTRLVRGSGVDVGHFGYQPMGNTKRFLMISRLLKNKGVVEFGEAACRILHKRSDISFDLVGFMDEGPDGIAAKQVDRWCAAGLVFHGPQADVRPYIYDSMAYVLPSYREGTPRSVLEAMSCGRAIITTDAPGCRETVIAGENGYLVPVADIEPLVQAITDLADSPDRAGLMGVQSRKIAEDRFDVRKVNQNIIAILEEVI